MAGKGRRPSIPLIEELRNRPYRFDFYQAVRIVERFRSAGTDTDAPLPRSFTERLLRRSQKKDTVWQAFLDIFNHRLASLMVRMRKLHRIGHDLRPPHQTLFAKLLWAFVGLGTDGLQNRMSVDDRSLLRYVGLLAQRPRNTVGLERMLSDYYGVPVKVRQFSGSWIDLEDDQLTRLGGRMQGRSGLNDTLGDAAVLGSRYCDQQAGIELRISPLDRGFFESFLPGGSRNQPLMSLVMFYISPEYDFEARLLALPDAVPASVLGADLRLGWTSWLRSEPADAVDSQVSITVRGREALAAI